MTTDSNYTIEVITSSGPAASSQSSVVPVITPRHVTSTTGMEARKTVAVELPTMVVVETQAQPSSITCANGWTNEPSTTRSKETQASTTQATNAIPESPRATERRHGNAGMDDTRPDEQAPEMNGWFALASCSAVLVVFGLITWIVYEANTSHT